MSDADYAYDAAMEMYDAAMEMMLDYEDWKARAEKAEAALREILNIARQSDPDSDMGKIVSIIHKAMDIRP